MRSVLPFLRHHRGFAALMLLILASTPILDGGCFTYNQIRTSRKECWSDLHAPCAAYMGKDGSLTLILPDQDDLKKARFFAARFTAEEVKAVAQVMAQPKPGTLNAPPALFDLGNPPKTGGIIIPPNANRIALENGPMAVRTPEGPHITAANNLYNGVTLNTPPPQSLKLRPLRQDPRMTVLTGTTESEWLTALPPGAHGGYWLHAAPAPLVFMGENDNPFGNPQRLPACWAFADDGRFQYTFQRDGGTYMRPTAGVLLVPVSLAADVVTSPIQLVVLIGAGIDSATSK